MIPEHETMISLGDVPKFLDKRDGRRPGISTVYRWVSSGLHGARLEVIYRAGRPYTSVEALRRFDEAVTQAKLEPVQKSRGTSEKQAATAHLRAKRKLAGNRRQN